MYAVCKVGFPTGQDSLVSWDKETEISSLFQDKRTMGQAQNLATNGLVRAGLGRDFDILARDGQGF